MQAAVSVAQRLLSRQDGLPAKPATTAPRRPARRAQPAGIPFDAEALVHGVVAKIQGHGSVAPANIAQNTPTWFGVLSDEVVMVDAPHDVEVAETVRAITAAAVRYRNLTGKPLGITGELGEVQAARILKLKLAPARQAGYDATDAGGRRLQIKARCILEDSKPGQRVGSIKLNHEWDAVVLVLMDHNFEPTAAYEASREAVEKALKHPGSKARNERGALAVSKFKSIGKMVWSRDPKPV